MKRNAAFAALVLLLPACGGPLSMIPPADMALLSSDMAPMPVVATAPLPDRPVEDMVGHSLQTSFRAVLCDMLGPAEAAGRPDCAGQAAAPVAIAAPAAISVDDLLARVRGEDDAGS